MEKEPNLSDIDIISKWFGGLPQNIRKTYKVKKPQSYRVIDMGSYLLENNIDEQELEMAVEYILKIRGINGK